MGKATSCCRVCMHWNQKDMDTGECFGNHLMLIDKHRRACHRYVITYGTDLCILFVRKGEIEELYGELLGG